MARENDVWYVRLPDGRTLRARGVEELRAALRAGRVPWESRARRRGEEAWQPISRYREFADAAPPQPRGAAATANGPAERYNGDGLRTVGVRGLVEELFNAFDSSLGRAKWVAGALTGLVLAAASVALEQFAGFPADHPARVAGQLGALGVMLGMVSVCTFLLSRMTAVELSQFRPARPAEVREGLALVTFRIFLAQGVVVALVLGLAILLRTAPSWLGAEATADDGGAVPVENAALAVARVLVEVFGGAIVLLAVPLLGPILVVEEVSALRALREWLGMLRRHLRRVYLYEALALMVATVLTLPLLLFLAASYTLGESQELFFAERVTRRLLLGLALTPAVTYLLVANVFIYLNLRYEFHLSPRDK